MLSRAWTAFFNAKLYVAAVGQIIALPSGLAYVDYRLDQQEKAKVEKENPGCIVKKVPVKCYEADYWRYACFRWAVFKKSEVSSQALKSSSTSQVRCYYLTSIDEVSKKCNAR